MEHSITATGRVSTSLPSEILERVEAFAAEKKLNRSEAIGALIALGLRTQDPTRARREPMLPRYSFV
jgi:metal-responsive CopG/Arc/MetJ family transcriptional regulator